jgi:type IV pilus assembly protein PilP
MTRKLLKNRFILLCSVPIVCISFFSGCKKEQPPAAPPVQQPNPQPMPVQKPVSSALRLLSPPTHKFDFSAKKDPFKPFIIVTALPVKSSENAKKLLSDSLPIHSLEVSQFKLIGVVIGEKESKAMVTEPGGKGYVLKVGMSIGNNDGKVVSISTGGVEVLEQFKDENGRVHKETIKLTLPRKQ